MKALLLAAVMIVLGPGTARADESGEDVVAVELRDAITALQVGDYARAAELAGPIASRSVGVDKQDRAEAWRIYGLALFFLDRRGQAETALLEYLKLDVDAHLDPSLVPPEAIVFFEDIRSRHSAELRKYRPVPKTTARTFLKNLLPPWGQFQNRHHGRGWFIGVSETVLLGVHLTSFFVLRSWCDSLTGTCVNGDVDHTSAARKLRTLNLVAGVALIGVYTYGVVDGLINYRRLRRRRKPTPPSMSVGVVPTQSGAYLSVVGRF